MNEIQFKQLLENYITGKLSGAAQKQFFELLEEEQYRKIFEKCLEEEWLQGKYEQEGNAQVYSQIEQNVLSKINEILARTQVKKRATILSIKKIRLVAAAILLFLITGTAVLFFQRKTKPLT